MSARLRSVLFWSIITAAFIGPGTVTTAARAGSSFGLSLLWALLFSIVATLVLQEAAARLTLGAGKPLGEIIGQHQGTNRRWAAGLLFSAVALGCGAYQAGNLLGAFAGLTLLGLSSKWALVGFGLLAAALLWTGNNRLITQALAAIVGLMGIVFCWVALGADSLPEQWLSGMVPQLEDDALLLVIGLVGTTIVPYNLFLASGLSQGQDLREMRFGLLTVILIGGGITLAIMLTGTTVQGDFSFNNLALALDARLGGQGHLLLGLGLFAAGFTSAITAPLAAAITGQSLLGWGRSEWASTGMYYRLTWGLILFAGLGFALTDVKPIPAIIAAQAVNGIILPLVAVFLLLAVNNPKILPPAYRNSLGLNVLSVLIVGSTIFLGLRNVWLVLSGLFG